MQVGSIVECIKNDEDEDDLFFIDCTFPKKGKIYTVSEIVTRWENCIRLEEIHNPLLYFDYDNIGWVEICFEVDYFRELLPPININKELEIEELITDYEVCVK